MTFLDFVALLILVVTFLAGLRSGLLPQAGGLIGALLGGFVAIQLLPIVRDPIDSLDPSIRALVVLGLPVLTADYDFWLHIDDCLDAVGMSSFCSGLRSLSSGMQQSPAAWTTANGLIRTKELT